MRDILTLQEIHGAVHAVQLILLHFSQGTIELLTNFIKVASVRVVEVKIPVFGLDVVASQIQVVSI